LLDINILKGQALIVFIITGIDIIFSYFFQMENIINAKLKLDGS